jgi:tetratricopeptide (TPR) repeat protein
MDMTQRTEAMPEASTPARLRWIAVTIGLAVLASVASHVTWRGGAETEMLLRGEPAIGMPGAPPTSAEGLARRIDAMEARLLAQPRDHAAPVLLAEALLRRMRVAGDARAAGRAERLLTSVLKDVPGHYEALRLLGAVHLSQHRFRDAREIGRRARNLRPGDSWNYGVIGDASIELGDYDEAFEAFDTMMDLRPNAAAYARVAYARELRGDLTGALEAMRMAAAATSAHDPEAGAWYAAQIGELHLRTGRLADAEREYRRAAFLFPDHPLAAIGRGTLQAARGQRAAALATFLEQFQRTPGLDLAARIGDLYAEGGSPIEGERYYRLAEELAGPSLAQTEAALALFLSERGRRLSDAVAIAEAVAATRHDIFTEDALSWAYYKTGRFEEAWAASRRALRTGTRDERILAHNAAIRSSLERR